MAYRQMIQFRIYGTSSRSATNFNTPKDSNMNVVKTTTESLLSLIWKSLAFATSALKPSSLSRTAAMEAKEVIAKNAVEDIVVKDNITDSSFNSSSHSSTSDKHPVLEVDDITSEKVSDSEETFYDWLTGKSASEKKKGTVQEHRKSLPKVSVCKSSLEQRSRFLVESLRSATSSSSHNVRLEEICKHLLTYPQQKNVMCKEGLLRVLLWLKSQYVIDPVSAEVQMALSLLGYHNPPRANGIRILSIDGGGTRGIMAIEILRQLEERTNCKIYELFDYICGVSSGAILAVLVGGLRLSLDECETLYRKLSFEVFSQSPIWGTGQLMWNHAYYDTTIWVQILQNVFEDKLLIDVAKDESSPKLSAISAVMNLPTLRPFVFRNYDFPSLSQSQYLGSCSYKMWEAIRASGAAPGYFEEFILDDYVHQDGGIMINNPTALAIHESHLLWPSESIQCVMSLGSGRYTPAAATDFTSTSLKIKILKLIDSATDTEGVHVTLHDLLSSNTYLRFNPYLTEFLYLDENRPEKFQQLKNDAQMYLRRNEYKFSHAAKILTQPRSYHKKVQDWMHVQKLMLF